MKINEEITKILSAFSTIKKDLLDSSKKHLNYSPLQIKDQLNAREIQLTTVIEISEKLIKDLVSLNSSHSVHHGLTEYEKKYQTLEKLYKSTEENLYCSIEEIKALKSKLETLSKNSSENNLFSVEVYESEIQDLKKENQEKVLELQKQIQALQSSNLQKKFVTLSKKYSELKEVLDSQKGKVLELEEIIEENNSQKKTTEKKYCELVETHKKMFKYLETLEMKVIKFQKNQKGRSFTIETSASSKNLNLSSRECGENRVGILGLFGPMNVFTVESKINK